MELQTDGDVNVRGLGGAGQLHQQPWQDGMERKEERQETGGCTHLLRSRGIQGRKMCGALLEEVDSVL